MTPLRAVTNAFQGEPDLLAFAGEDGMVFEREGVGWAARGVAATIELPNGLAAADAAGRVQAALDAIEHEGVGPGPLAAGALPFDSHRPTTMVVPRAVLRRSEDGTCTITTVGDDAVPAPVPAPGAAPDGFTLTSCRPHEQWRQLIEDAVAEIASGRLTKVVLAREVMVEANRPIVIGEVLGRLRALYPSCTVFALGGFVGASPELLVARRGRTVRAHPLAGTLARSGDPVVDDRTAAGLLASDKDRREHRAVIDDIVGALTPVCDELDAGDPEIVYLRNVIHLGTRVAGTLTAPPPSALALAGRLHPTPAVGGTPTDAAVKWLAEAEGFDRGHYAGPVGWVDGNGDGEFVVGIRAAEIDGSTARLMAGVGVVAGSDPAAELAETQLKLQALLAAVVRP